MSSLLESLRTTLSHIDWQLAVSALTSRLADNILHRRAALSWLEGEQ